MYFWDYPTVCSSTRLLTVDNFHLIHQVAHLLGAAKLVTGTFAR
jgi:hypothetical protein